MAFDAPESKHRGRGVVPSDSSRYAGLGQENAVRPIYAIILILLGVCCVPQSTLAYYNPSTGRWLTRDPMGEGGSSRGLAASNRFMPKDSTVGPNHYAFVENQSIGFIDPLGLFMSSVHRDLTRDAVSKSTVQLNKDCKEKVANILIEANIGQDSGAAFSKLERHFNRPYAGVESGNQVDAARRTWDAKFMAYLQSEESAFDKAIAASDCKGALEALGRITHSWQDFYAHAISSAYQPGSPFFEDGHFVRFQAWTEGRGGTPASHPELWPSSYNAWWAWSEGEHPNLSEPVSGDEAWYRRDDALKYTTAQYNGHLERWRVACPCSCGSQ